MADIEEDERVLEEYIEENLDTDLRQSDEFHAIVDSLFDEIEKRFATLDGRRPEAQPAGLADDLVLGVRRSRRLHQDGQLASPATTPSCSADCSRRWSTASGSAGRSSRSGHRRASPLVLVDGEGLGHTPKSVATLSTHVATQLQDVDAVLLVDNAAQPMQAAPVAASKGIVVSGNASQAARRLHPLRPGEGRQPATFSAREEHVLASVENVLKAIGEELARPRSECCVAGSTSSLLRRRHPGASSTAKKKARHRASIEQFDVAARSAGHTPSALPMPGAGRCSTA